MIAKSLSTSQKFARLHQVAGKRAEFCQALYPLLVAHSDDFGRLAGDVFTVKHLVVPTSPRQEPDIEIALRALHDVDLIVWYRIDGREIIQIQGFDNHQQGLHKRTRSEFPDPSGIFREIPSEEKGREGKRKEENTPRLRASMAGKKPEYTEWVCPHIEPCADRGRCHQSTLLGRPVRQEKSA